MTDSTPARLRSLPSVSPSDPEERRPPLAVVEPAPEPSSRRTVWLLLAVVVLPRLLLLPFNENLYGDAVVRTDFAQRWAEHPHWIASYDDGAFQFGPLQIYLVGLVLKVGVPAELAGRLVSLVFGALTVLPLLALTRRLFGQKAALWACLAFSAWGMHLQMSTTAGSEALSLFLVVSALALFAEGLDENRFSPLLLSALVLNLAAATRYDTWLLIPLMTLLLLLGDKDRVAAITRGVLFGLLCLPFPLIWMQGNAMAKGDALYPIHDIEQFHRNWVGSEMAALSNLGFRLESLFFWPGAALVTLTPLVAFFGMVGMKRAWKERPDVRWLLWVCWAPALYYVFKSVVLANFVPIARFTVTQVALLLPFVEPGFRALTEQSRPGTKRTLTWAMVAVAVALPLWLGAFTFRSEGRAQDALRPVSPTSTNPPAVMQVASYLKHEVAEKGGSIILDEAPQYMDLQIRFFSGLPEARTASHRFGDFDFQKHLKRLEPGYMVLADGGTLRKELALSHDGAVAKLGDREFVEVPGFSAPYHVYKRR